MKTPTTAEERLVAAEAALRHMDEFLAMLGHELRNPLAALKMGLTLLEEERTVGPRSERIRATMTRQTEQLARLVDDLLDLARITHGKIALQRTTVDVRDVVEHAVDDARPSYALMGVTLTVDLVDRPALVDGDAARLGQVMANVLDNALKYTPEGEGVRASVSIAEDWIRVSVADSGVGIEPSKLGELFQLFVQDDTAHPRREGGLGIGLTVIRRLVTLHGGHVRLTSAGKGLGAELTIELPQTTATRVASDKKLPDPLVKPNGSLTVLLVDDHVDTRDLFAEYLTLMGHDVTTASDGGDALRLLDTRRFDVAVVDIGLPDLDGYAVAERARAAGHDLDLVALTGYGSIDREVRAAGFDAYLVKPVDPSRLVATLLRRR